LRRWDRLSAPREYKAAADPIAVERMEAVVKKIVQGLHFYHTGRLLSSEVRISIQPGIWDGKTRTASGKIYRRQPPQLHSRGSYGEFKYARMTGRYSTTWILVFHDRFMFSCEVRITV
jgi:hypothetical protein